MEGDEREVQKGGDICKTVAWGPPWQTRRWASVLPLQAPWIQCPGGGPRIPHAVWCGQKEEKISFVIKLFWDKTQLKKWKNKQTNMKVYVKILGRKKIFFKCCILSQTSNFANCCYLFWYCLPKFELGNGFMNIMWLNLPMCSYNVCSYKVMP